MSHTPNYRIETFPRTRLASLDVLHLGLRKHHVKALLEVDVTEARRKIRAIAARTGQKPSFSAWFAAEVSRSLQVFPRVHSLLAGRRKRMVFSEVNIALMVEKKVNGKSVPIPLLLRQTEQKSVADLTQEIRKAQQKQMDEKGVTLNRKSASFAENLYFRLPAFLRRLTFQAFLSNPRRMQRQMGTAIITSIGMMGQIHGWFIQSSVHPLSIGLGSAVPKARVVEGEIQVREVLHMTVLLDHDVVDGAPMARFIRDLVGRLERAETLDAME